MQTLPTRRIIQVRWRFPTIFAVAPIICRKFLAEGGGSFQPTKAVLVGPLARSKIIPAALVHKPVVVAILPPAFLEVLLKGRGGGSLFPQILEDRTVVIEALGHLWLPPRGRRRARRWLRSR